ncbi:MAG: ribbon-helix-helix protein, CopG family [Acidobacteria bacterium]|nr:ribbon-helix-helix protein, CopG family [Acidobacteriota bacterium]
MPSSKVTISLPTELLERADSVRKQRHYSRSELFREALRFHLLPTYTPTPEERKEIDAGLAEIERGEYVEFGSAADLIRELEGSSK